MPLNGASASSKRKNFSNTQNSLPTYEEATEKVSQDGLAQMFTTLELVGDEQGQSASSDRRNNTYNYSYDQTTTNQDLSRGQGLQRPLQRPAMVHHRYYRVWHTGNTDTRPDYRQMQKQDNLSFHIVSYLIGIIIVLVLIVLIVKLAQKLVTDE